MYVVIGANGYFGSYLLKNILEYTDEQIVATARNLENAIKENSRITWECLDVQNKADVYGLKEKIKKEKDIKMIYLAAFHHPDEVENKKNLAWNINVIALAEFINIFADCVKKFFYSSSDVVYGDSIDNYEYMENDLLNPVNFYGHNKCVSESLVVHRGYNVFRFPFMISPSIIYKKHFYDEIVTALKGGKKIEMFVDSYRSAISFDNAAYIMIYLIENKKIPKILNICGSNALSKYDVGLKIAERENLDKKLIIPVSIEKFQVNNFRVKRAKSTLMSNNMLRSLLNIEYIDVFEKPNLSWSKE
ncbi:dTDP-4-dehydrorhamnose reductase [Lachnospiraceae bacterium RM5]|nr:dTDP-4-dehydrorhamnose reductase [Lachnospiraceae bacterium RM5]